jgi:FkbM family methyltransferase
MLKIISRPISKFLYALGYTISPIQNLIPPTTDKNWLQKLDINTVIDIGANEGQFIQRIRTVLPHAKIFAFEPIPGCYKKIKSDTDNADVTAFNFGLSDREGSMDINISNNLASSSFLDMKELHKSSFPEAVFVDKQQVTLKRLDDALSDYSLKTNILIKVDVQGYEEKVILGGEKTFEAATAVLVEAIFEPFYEGQWLFDDIYNHFTSGGFKFMGFTDQEHSKASGIPLFADAIFIRREMVPVVL